MNDKMEDLKVVVVSSLYGKPMKSEGELRKLIKDLALVIAPELSEDELEQVARHIETNLGISAGLFSMVEGEAFKPWLDDAKKLINPFYWKRYREYLTSDQGVPNDVVTKLDRVTERVLGRLGNPNLHESWDRRGMVVGHVQSGKTSNYLGLMCKAADAGYRLIIVVAGLHNNLRNQTQRRIDLGFIGRDTGKFFDKNTNKNNIGVGLFNYNKTPVSLTNTIKDFNKDTASSNTSEIDSYKVPVVLVVKKNVNTLSNLNEWLNVNSRRGDKDMIEQPMLLIDDEADNASINIKYNKKNISKINGLIRELLNKFHRSCYVGYTATPFANIFIDPDQDDDMFKEDLFPKDFIVGLNTPSNYFGHSKLFKSLQLDDNQTGEVESEWLRYITDNEDILPIRHKIDHQLEGLPQSLKDALHTFLLARVIRNLRGQTSAHCSMLVNASRFTAVQGKIRNLLHEELEEIKNSVRINASKGESGLDDPNLSALHSIWQKEFMDTSPPWHEIQSNLFESIASGKVVEVNSNANDLDYEESEGQTVIAVGGFSLSRGMTLEGLTVTWFLRNSTMYDTLMQMGRWFGYRPDYEDLCRIWMPFETADWYAFIANATDELHEELKTMERDRLTPLEFGLAVRSHSATLHVTARSKLGAGQRIKTKVRLSNQFVETARVSSRESDQKINLEIARNFVSELQNSNFKKSESSNGYLYSCVPVALVDEFLSGWKNAVQSFSTNPNMIRKYIEPRIESELKEWDVLISSLVKGESNESLGIPIKPIRRYVNLNDLKHGFFSFSGQKARLGSRGMEKTGINQELVDKVERKYYTERNVSNYPDYIYRKVRSRALFILHLVNVTPASDQKEDERAKCLPNYPVIGWGISLPPSNIEEHPVEYVVNSQKYKELYGFDFEAEVEDIEEELYDD